MNKRLKQANLVLIYVGFVIWLTAYLLPDKTFHSILPAHVPWSYFAVVKIIPKVGFVSLFLALACRHYRLALPSLVLVASPMIATGLVYLIRGV